MTERDRGRPEMHKDAATARIPEAPDMPEGAEDGRDDLWEIAKAILFACLIALGIRSFAYEPFNIPSGSMIPTLQVGDYLFVSKKAYGYSRYSFPLGIASFDGRILEKPVQRGDVAVFRQPRNDRIDYIKRIVGLPGDRIQVKSGILHINGEPVPRALSGTHQEDEGGSFVMYSDYVETLPGGVQHRIQERSDQERFDDTREFIVPPGHYFAMGDNRDNSLDSRAQEQVGFVPARNLVGRANRIFFSVDFEKLACDIDMPAGDVVSFLCKVVKFPFAVRYDRILHKIE